MYTAQWPQERMVKPMEEIIVPNNTTSRSNSKANSNSLERKIRPQKVQALNCPRCNSTNTKFCYYNNYSLSQPRYFCKTCRRYWTEGGSLRNIPVGGGSRKNKRSSSSSNSSKKLPSLVLPQPSSTENLKIHDGQDLNLGFPTHDIKTISHFIQVPNFENSDKKSHLSALEPLTGVSSRGCGNSNNSFMPITISDPCTIYSSGFSLPTLEFSLDWIGNSGYGSLQESGNSGRASFPFEDLKQVSSTSDHMEQNREQGDSTGYWSGALGGGSW